jgi:shikimate dehydrogenase
MTITLNGKTRLYPLLGDPIIYARSPDWLSHHMAKRGMNMISLPMEVPEGALDTVMAGLAATKNVDGLSLTMPHKIADDNSKSVGGQVASKVIRRFAKLFEDDEG